MLDKFMFGVQVTILCMTIVFLVLILLSYIIKVQKVFVEKIEGLKEKKTESKVENTAVPVIAATEEDSEELVAVISAAVASMLNRPASNIRVRSIRMVSSAASLWSAAGRQDQINSRF